MTERELLLYIGPSTTPSGLKVVVVKSIDRDDFPVKKGVIRMDYYKVSKVWEEGEDLRIIEFSNFNMKGYFPAKLINMTMGSAAAGQLGQMYQQVKDAEAEMIKNGEPLR